MSERSDAYLAGRRVGEDFRRRVGSYLAKSSIPWSKIRPAPLTGELYPYQGLQSSKGEIRLLNLLPGSGREILHCNLIHSFISLSLDNQPGPEYEAISYHWGDPTPCKKCIVDNVSIRIPASAYDVLVNLRLPSSSRTVWIDAVCVNQQDDVERGEQIAVMASIYRQCSTCVVWLGRDTRAPAQKAFEILDAVPTADDGPPDTNLPPALSRYKADERHVVKSVFSAMKQGAKLSPVTGLYNRPWFHRKWTLQEMVLPRQVDFYCGQVQRPIRTIFRGAEYLASKVYVAELFDEFDYFSNLCKVYPLLTATQAEHLDETKSCTIRTILTMARSRKASHPKDAIFALLGLIEAKTTISKDLLQTYLQPNYQRSLEEIISCATKCSFYEEKNLNALVQVFPRRLRRLLDIDSFRSWAPLWHFPDTELLDWGRRGLNECFDASIGLPFGLLPANPVWSEDDLETIRCQGTVIDSVMAVHKYLDPTALQTPAAVKGLVEWLQSYIQSSRSPYLSDTEKSAATAMTLTAGEKLLGSGLATQDDVNAFATFLDALMESAPRPVLRQRLVEQIVAENVSIEDLPVAQSLGGMQRASIHRIAFVTEQGVTGIGPSNMAAGDHLVLLHGCKWPVILRAKEAAYELLEVCYAHGFMLGRPQWPKRVKTREKIVVIR